MDIYDGSAIYQSILKIKKLFRNLDDGNFY